MKGFKQGARARRPTKLVILVYGGGGKKAVEGRKGWGTAEWRVLGGEVVNEGQRGLDMKI